VRCVLQLEMKAWYSRYESGLPAECNSLDDDVRKEFRGRFEDETGRVPLLLASVLNSDENKQNLSFETRLLRCQKLNYVYARINQFEMDFEVCTCCLPVVAFFTLIFPMFVDPEERS